MINAEIARVFKRIADLLEVDAADGFRINSYRRAAKTLQDTSEDIADLAAQKQLTKLPGIGKSMADRINQYLQSGKIDLLTELEAKYPSGIIDLLEIPSLGPKKVALVHSRLGVNDLEGLKKCIDSGALAELPGFGEASVKKISEGITFLDNRGGRTALGEAMPIAEEFLDRVRKFAGVERAELAGSLRRGVETIGDVDIVCIATDAKAAVSEFVTLPQVNRVLASGDTKGSITFAVDGKRELQIDFRAMPAESFGAAWQYFTGSKEHNVRLREMAVRKKWRLNEYALLDGEKVIAGATEEGIYQALGLSWIPPELREDRGEFEPGFSFSDLVTLSDIRGDLHMHTVASDGRHTIEELAEAAKARGYEYIAICDHSKSSVIANGLSIERMQEHIDLIRQTDKRLEGITVLVGCECDILPDGRLDYPDDILAACDWVVASVHSAQGHGGAGKLSSTERTLAAIENRWVSAIGHPTGRIINKRPAMDLDMNAVTVAAAANHTMLEINASWKRLDLKDVHARQAIAAGVMLTINTDTHRLREFDYMRYGVITARRAGAKKSDVANCLSLTQLRKRIAAKRS